MYINADLDAFDRIFEHVSKRVHHVVDDELGGVDRIAIDHLVAVWSTDDKQIGKAGDRDSQVSAAFVGPVFAQSTVIEASDFDRCQDFRCLESRCVHDDVGIVVNARTREDTAFGETRDSVRHQ